VLNSTYDFIVSCEVIEHFYNPAQEFKLLNKLLKKHAPLVVKTDLHDSNTNFDTWYYRLDPTHVAFYSVQTLEWIRNSYGFKSLDRVSARTYVFWN